MLVLVDPYIAQSGFELPRAEGPQLAQAAAQRFSDRQPFEEQVLSPKPPSCHSPSVPFVESPVVLRQALPKQGLDERA